MGQIIAAALAYAPREPSEQRRTPSDKSPEIQGESPRSGAAADERSSASLRTALILTGIYVAVAAAYVVASSALAAQVAQDVAQLEQIEMLKGFAIVGVTGMLVFVGAFVAARRVETVKRELSLSRRALVAAESRAASGLVVATIAHDTNNMLSALLSELELVSERGAQPSADKLARVQTCADRLVELNRRLRATTLRRERPQLRPLDMLSTLREHLASLHAHPALRGCKVTLHGEERLFASADPLLWLQMLGNLLINAGEATAGRGTLEVRVAASEHEITVEVHDDGPGVPPEQRANLFHALASTKPDGSGLGLYSVNACAHGMGAQVEVADSPLGGALFRVRLRRTHA